MTIQGVSSRPAGGASPVARPAVHQAAGADKDVGRAGQPDGDGDGDDGVAKVSASAPQVTGVGGMLDVTA